MGAVDSHAGETGVYSAMDLIPQSANPDAGASSGNGTFWVDQAGALHYKTPAGVDKIVQASINTSTPPELIAIPVVLSKHSNGSIAARFTPGFAGSIVGLSFSVTDPVTTGAKAATFTPAIAGVSTTGGAVALTSANCTPVGAGVAGSAVTAGNTFTAGQEVTIVASGVTAFVEGQGVLYLALAAS